MTTVAATSTLGLRLASPRRAFDNAHRLMVSVVMVFAIILLHPYGFLEAEDGPVYFGYMNNQLHPGIPYYYAGYVALMPELVAGLASFLPMPLQPPIYMASAAVFGVYFVYQLTIFLEYHLSTRPIAVLIACATALFIVKTNSSHNFFTNLTYSIWPAWLGLFLRILNGFRQVPASWAEVAIGILAALSHPYCVLLLPPLLALTLALPKSCARRWMIELAFYASAIGLYLIAGIDHSIVKPVHLDAIVAKAVSLIVYHPSVYGLIALSTQTSLIVTGLHAVIQIAFGRKGGVDLRHATYERLILSYAGCATFLAYVSSPRFIDYDTLQPRYVIPAAVCSILALVLVVVRQPAIALAIFRIQPTGQTLIPSLRRQPRLFFVSVVGLLSILGVAEIKGRQTPPIGLGAIWQGEQFLMGAESFRGSCRDGAYARDWTKWSLVILCKRAELPAAIEPVPIGSDTLFMSGASEPTTTAGREPGTVPTLFRSVHENPLFHLP